MSLETIRPARSSVGDRRRLPALIFRRAALVACLATACGGNGSVTRNDGDGGALGPTASGIALAHRVNTLSVRNHDTQCSFCACRAYVPASDSCEAALLDSFPPAKRMVVCEIAAAEIMEACLSLAQSCDDAQKCEAAQQRATASCPTFDPGQLPDIPSGC